MCKHSCRCWYIMTVVFWLILTIARQTFDLIGKLWIPVVVDLFQVSIDNEFFNVLYNTTSAVWVCAKLIGSITKKNSGDVGKLWLLQQLVKHRLFGIEDVIPCDTVLLFWPLFVLSFRFYRASLVYLRLLSGVFACLSLQQSSVLFPQSIIFSSSCGTMNSLAVEIDLCLVPDCLTPTGDSDLSNNDFDIFVLSNVIRCLGAECLLRFQIIYHV